MGAERFLGATGWVAAFRAMAQLPGIPPVARDIDRRSSVSHYPRRTFGGIVGLRPAVRPCHSASASIQRRAVRADVLCVPRRVVRGS